MAIFYTSDLHFGHANIIQYCNRPWATVDEMNAGLVANWNSVVGPDDTVFVLGDFAMNRGATLHWVSKLNGRKILIIGNHDSCFLKRCKGKKEKQWAEILRYIEAGWWDVLPEGFAPVGLFSVELNHFPYLTQECDQRYPNYRPVDSGTVLLCGHIHTNWRTHRSVKGTLMVNVGVDVWNWTPVAEEKLVELIREENT